MTFPLTSPDGGSWSAIKSSKVRLVSSEKLGMSNSVINSGFQTVSLLEPEGSSTVMSALPHFKGMVGDDEHEGHDSSSFNFRLRQAESRIIKRMQYENSQVIFIHTYTHI